MNFGKPAQYALDYACILARAGAELSCPMRRSSRWRCDRRADAKSQNDDQQ